MRPTAKHWAELGESKKVVEEELEKPEELGTPHEYGPQNQLGSESR